MKNFYLQLPNVKHIVYFEDQQTRLTDNENYNKGNVEIHPFKEFLHKVEYF